LDIKVIRSLPWERVDYKSWRSRTEPLSLSLTDSFSDDQSPEVLVSAVFRRRIQLGWAKLDAVSQMTSELIDSNGSI